MATSPTPPSAAPIIIKKVYKKGGHGHHGGAWKVAYADFVTAMMAFFLLMWLVNMTSEEQKQGIANYFSNRQQATSAILGGTSALTKEMAPGVSILTDPKASEKLEEMAEADRFSKIQNDLKQAISAHPQLKDLADSVIMDITPEGLRIQIVDQEGRPMFNPGSAQMLQRMESLLYIVTQAVRRAPNQVKISGHTDATPFRGQLGYNNWELSADRAQTTRRNMVQYGLPAEQVEYVAGMADRQHLDKDNPTSPRNRRIAITLLKQELVGN